MVQHLTSSWPAVKKQTRSRATQPALIILGIIDFLSSSASSRWSRSQLALQGMISPGTLPSIHSLIFFSHLFFFLAQSSSDRFIRQTTCLAVMNLWVFRMVMSALLHSPCRTHLLASNWARTLARMSISSLASLLLVLLTCLSKSSIRLVTYSKSFKTSSEWMIYMSLIGSTSFSTCVTSSSSKALTTWQIPSTSLMLLRKWFPRPSPLEAPLTIPAMSITDRTAATSDLGFHISQSLLKRASGTGTTALLGSIVQKGQFSAAT